MSNFRTCLYIILLFEIHSTGSVEFLPHGNTAGDRVLETNSSVSITASTPFVFYHSPQQIIYVNTDGTISFGTPLQNRKYNGNITLPSDSDVGDVPFLAPLWSDYSVSSVGVVSYRMSESSDLIGRVVGLLSASNSELAGYMPSLLFIATWNGVPMDLQEPNKNVTFQVILSTDGVRSFATFLYGSVHMNVSYLIGFNAGDRVTGEVVASSETTQDSFQLEMLNHRIDGSCITSSSQSCSLSTFSESCPSSGPVCVCLSGHSNITGTCRDIDECSGINNCSRGSTCVNTIGSYQCPCQRGYYGIDNVDICIDTDECSIGISECHANATCNNTMGGFQCTCNHGFRGNGKTCIQEESLTSCREGSVNCVCEGEGSGQSCYCNPGFNITSGNGTCQDIDECREGTAQCSHVCLNQPGSYSCTCLPGYYLATDGVTCLDINECTTNLHNCDANATCSNNDGSFSCTCREGFNGDGLRCFTADVCSPGTHTCQQVCMPTDNRRSFRCLCLPGYLLNPDGTSCRDLDECSTGLHNCNPTWGMCANTNGSFTCSCRSGFFGDGVTCLDIDECSVGLDNCDRNHICENTEGSFVCRCPMGFLLQSGVCIRGKPPNIRRNPVVRPISEFVYDIGNDFCVERTNFTGLTAVIKCEPGGEEFPQPSVRWKLNTFSGIFLLPIPQVPYFTINESNRNSLTIDLTSFLESERFGIVCERRNAFGFQDVRTIISVCNDNQCQDGITNNCTVDCTRNDTDYTCLCNHGFTLSTDGVSCQDIDECDSSINPTAHNCDLNSTTCTNTPGSFSCDCRPGYAPTTPPSTSCSDVDECALIGNCPPRSTYCVNTIGSFLCNCSEGYERSDEGSCVDVDECILNSHNCSATEKCNNTDGGFTCVCKEGYELLEDMCTDINECLSGVCGHGCNNTNGSFICSCQQGYVLSSDQRACTDINECEEGSGVCDPNSHCVNQEGSFSCECDQFYEQRSQGSQCQVSLTSVVVPSIIVVFFVIILVVLITAIICYLHTKKKMEYKVADRSNDYQMAGNTSTPSREQSVLSEIPQNLLITSKELNIDYSKSIGEGEFGIVYKAKFRMEPVAVKLLKGFTSDFDARELLEEVDKMKVFAHRNILMLRGVVLDVGSAPCIVMPYMANGSLKKYLQREDVRETLLLSNGEDNDTVFEASRKLMDMCLQIAKGMEYLSSMKVIHRDLAARNCMMDKSNVIKVSDFGLSVSMAEDKNYFKASIDAGERLPVKWMAPESLLDHKFSEESDVWSYGVTCWEVFSGGRNPYPTVKVINLLREIENGLVLDKPVNLACTDSMHELLMSCWNKKPSERPNFSTIVEILSQNLSELVGYLPLSLTSPSDFDDTVITNTSVVLDLGVDTPKSNSSGEHFPCTADDSV